MPIYLHDGSFEGVLSALRFALENDAEVDDIRARESFQPDMFSVTENVETDVQASEAFLRDFKERCGARPALDLLRVHLSERHNAGLLIYRYVKLGLSLGKSLPGAMGEAVVRETRRLSRRVGAEVHRLQGLLRFYKLSDGLFYGPIEPDFNIVELLSRHFRRRMPEERWIIHDTRRHTGIYHHNGDWQEIRIINAPDVHQPQTGELDSAEDHYQELWKTFYEHIGIKERSNHKLRMQFMPKKYWKYLVEIEGDY